MNTKQAVNTPVEEEIEVSDASQTRFSEEIALQEQVPMPVRVNVPLVPSQPSVAKKYLLFGSLALVLFFGIIALFAMFMMSAPQEDRKTLPTVAAPTPSPTGAQAEIKRRLELLEETIESADPLTGLDPLPPVNFDLDLEDATAKKINRR